ncbi:hypothetical protein [Paenibacillus wynnii]|uniref:hypothetical protein n=1 Tax=Paenibacillus wynnii TaxID=268407 RepID=UPI002791BC34|nr:hypothetical protein [Paenibacillus wynnii]MDQ0196492.1 hypothetical protein [Paenibacillus wynnii]
MRVLLNIIHGAIYVVFLLLLNELRNMGIPTQYWGFYKIILRILLVLIIFLQATIIIKAGNKFIYPFFIQILSFLFILCLHGQAVLYMDEILTSEEGWIKLGWIILAEATVIVLALFLWKKMNRTATR